MRRSTRKAVHFIRETGRDQIKERIQARKRGDHVPSDLLNLILDIANDLEGDKDFSMENMLDEFVTLFIAGTQVHCLWEPVPSFIYSLFKQTWMPQFSCKRVINRFYATEHCHNVGLCLQAKVET